MEQLHRFDISNYMIPFGEFKPLDSFDPSYTGEIRDKKQSEQTLAEDIEDLANAQELIWASKEYSVLIILQALDAAGKDSAIKHVMSGINPQGCDVFAFKAPTEEERLHHFLWRPMKYLPPKGKISIFNRSYYEEVLVVRVHPELLNQVWLPVGMRNAPLEEIWQSRFEEINEFEHRVMKNGTLVLKFFLDVSREEQLKRFLARLKNEDKQWKFSASDYSERKHWKSYRDAYEQMLNATNTKHAPWYIIPADNKWYSRAVIADIITNRIEALNLQFPVVSEKQKEKLAKIKMELQQELKDGKQKLSNSSF